MLQSMLDMIHRFDTEIINLSIPKKPTRLSTDRKKHGVDFMFEELDEFCEADTLEDEADALIDLTYVALGRLVEMGLAPMPLFEEVHDANMRKVKGVKANRSEELSGGFDAIKPEGWRGPELQKYLEVTADDLTEVLLKKQFSKDVMCYFEELEFMDETEEETCGQLTTESGCKVLFVPENTHGVEPSSPPESFESFLGNIIYGTDKDEIETDDRISILVLGHAKHGKDTASEILRDMYGLRFISSSMFCAEKVIMPFMKNHGYKWRYKNVEECFEDRVNNRELWYEAICQFNNPDPTTLARAIFAENEIYCGMRSSHEFHAGVNAGLFDIVIWIDRSEHVGPEAKGSCTVEPWMADYIVDNNGTIDNLRFNLRQLIETLRKG